MQKKKLLTVALTIIMIVTLFTGCSQTDSQPQPSQNAPSESAAPAQDTTGSQAYGDVAKPDGYPSRTISWIVAADAGAAIDLPTRVLVEAIDLGGNIMIENISGASNAIGTLEAKVRDGDGYTILTTNSSGMVTQPMLNDTGYNPEDYRHIALLEPVVSHVVVVKGDSDIDSVEDWIELVQGDKDFFYATPNQRSASHLSIITALEELGSTADNFVPHNGSAEVLASVQNGSLDFGVIGISDSAIPQAEAGNIKIIVFLDDQVSVMAPDVPLISDYGVEGCHGFYGFKYVAVKKDTPDDIVEWIKQQITIAMGTDVYKEYIENQGLVAVQILTEEEMTAVVNDTYERLNGKLAELGMLE